MTAVANHVGDSVSTNAADRSYVLPPNSAWASLWKVMAVIALVGAVGAFVGYSGDPRRFAFSYLFAFLVFLTLGIGSLFFVLTQHLTGAGWGVTVRRTGEFLASGLFVFALLFLPVLGSLKHLYPWTETASHHTAPEGAGHSTSHATSVVGRGHEAAAHGGSHAVEGERLDPEHAAHLKVLAEKVPYLNIKFFLIRALVYFIAWTLLSAWFFRTSIRQDSTRDVQLTSRLERAAPPATFVLALTLTFAAFDWIMSLEPTWYSTIFGVYIFASAFLGALAVIIVLTMSLRASGIARDAINVEHFHDLGKLMFGFLVFWAYIGFSQFLLIWYASIPEETTFYHLRWAAPGWRAVSIGLVVAKFIVPLLFLLSRNIKRRLPLLRFGAAWLVLMHVVDLYWFVLPYYRPGVFELNLLDVACLLAVGGTYFSVVFFRMRRHAVIPVGDPRLTRALHFQNA